MFETKNNGLRYEIVVTKELLDLFREYRIFFSHSGADRFKIGGKIYFDKSSIIEERVGFYGGDQICTIGTMSYLAFVPRKYGTELQVGRYCSLGPIEIPGPRHPVEATSTSVFCYNRSHSFAKDLYEELDARNVEYTAPVRSTRKGPVVIRNDVWVGGNVVINPGLTIDSGSVIAANSVVTRNVGAYEIWGGNPARLIKRRFPQEIIDRLLDLNWWNYSPEDLSRIDFSDPESFINELEKVRFDLPNFVPKVLRLTDLLAT